MGGKKVFLLHWNDDERKQRADELRSHGFDVIDTLITGAQLFNKIEELQPQAVVIDLTRIPSQGRDLGIALRKRKGTREFPLVFVGGEGEKLEKLKAILPDAGYGSWDSIQAVINAIIERSPGELVIPESVFAAYAGKPLVEKLGISKGCRLLAVNEPAELDQILGVLPPGALIQADMDEEFDLTLWFTRTRDDLNDNLENVVSVSKQAPIWIAWPKKKSELSSDLSQQVVRSTCMQAGMVDYKICSIDQTWSALLFKWRGLPG